jgi:hypothetical protein
MREHGRHLAEVSEAALALAGALDGIAAGLARTARSYASKRAAAIAPIGRECRGIAQLGRAPFGSMITRQFRYRSQPAAADLGRSRPSARDTVRSPREGPHRAERRAGLGDRRDSRPSRWRRPSLV